MDIIYTIFEQLIDPQKLIELGGLALILLVIFSENGIFFCFFFPGDTLLFTTGIFSSNNVEIFPFNVYLVCLLIWVAAVTGNIAGYMFGKKVGSALYKKKDTLLFKKKYVYAAEAFFNRYGGMALIMGRFLPIIRTFAPIFAGIVKFDFKKFLVYNVVGGFFWVFSLTLAGYYIAQLFPGIANYLEYFIFGIIIITWIPVIRTYMKERKRMEAERKKAELQKM